MSADENEEALEMKNAPATLDVASLDEQSMSLLNQLIKETDADRERDLTCMFNRAQNKKTAVRIDKLSTLLDCLTDQALERAKERPDEMSNQELFNDLKIVQDLIERGQKNITGMPDQPMIQINQSTTEMNIGNDSVTTLNKESRDRVKNAVMSLLNLATAPEDKDIIEADTGDIQNDS